MNQVLGFRTDERVVLSFTQVAFQGLRAVIAKMTGLTTSVAQFVVSGNGESFLRSECRAKWYRMVRFSAV